MSASESRDLVRGFIDALARGDVADAAKRFHEDYRSNSWGGDLAETWSKMQAAQASGALSDAESEELALIADGDRVARHSLLRATHSGEFLGVEATGRRIDFHFIEIWRVRDGKIIEHWGGLAEAQRLIEQLRGDRGS